MDRTYPRVHCFTRIRDTAIAHTLADQKHESMKYLMTLMMASLLVASATAQENAGQTPQDKSRSEMMTERLTKELSLNAEQVTKVEAITSKYEKKAAGRPSAMATHDVAPDREGAMTEMNEALKTVLTAKQFEQWTKMQKGGNGTDAEGRKINEVKQVQ